MNGGGYVHEKKENIHKRKPHGHFCYVCGEHKANERFSGHGHVNHICKQCRALPVAKRNEMIAARRADNMTFSSRDFAHENMVNTATPISFLELDDKRKDEIAQRLGGLIEDFFTGFDYVPGNEDRDEIMSSLCAGMSETLNQWKLEDYGLSQEPQKELIADDALNAVFDDIVLRYISELKEGGIELPTFMDTLLVAETKRLSIRRFHKTDLGALWSIMRKLTVMYAWEYGFTKSETRKWLNRQFTRYQEDGYGYFAVVEKDSGVLIGQAGLMKSEICGEDVVEIGYIFDNTVWGQGYAIEAVRTCVDLAFNLFGIDRLYATIRPENIASIKVAEKLSMRKTGEYVKAHRGKKMPHYVFILENMQDSR